MMLGFEYFRKCYENNDNKMHKPNGSLSNVMEKQKNK
jgi:hypothetical protein